MKKERKLAQTLERTNVIVVVLSANPDGVSLTRLFEQTHLAKSTRHKILATLVCFRFVRQDPVTKKYYPGFQFLEPGNILLRQIDIRKEANPFLIALSDSIGETVHLVIRDRAAAICIDKIDSGIRCVAALIKNSAGQLVTAMSASCSSTRVTLDRIKTICHSGLAKRHVTFRNPSAAW